LHAELELDGKRWPDTDGDAGRRDLGAGEKYSRSTTRGRIAPGCAADLLLVHGDPTKDIHTTRDIVAIWKQWRAVIARAAARQSRSATRLGA